MLRYRRAHASGHRDARGIVFQMTAVTGSGGSKRIIRCRSFIFISAANHMVKFITVAIDAAHASGQVHASACGSFFRGVFAHDFIRMAEITTFVRHLFINVKEYQILFVKRSFAIFDGRRN